MHRKARPWQPRCKSRAGLAGAGKLDFTRITKENQDGKSRFSLLRETGILFSDVTARDSQ